METFDANGDGVLTQDEIDAAAKIIAGARRPVAVIGSSAVPSLSVTTYLYRQARAPASPAARWASASCSMRRWTVS